MKVIIFLGCCLLTGVIQAQYQPIFGDTTIAALSYRRVTYTGGGRDFPGGFVRADTSSGRVWHRALNASTELLVQDLNLAVGDFITRRPNFSCSHLGYATVRSVGTDTADRKVITLDCTFGGAIIYDTLQFIEGVGPNASLFWACITTDYRGDPSPRWNFAYAVCAQYQNGELRYAQNDCPLGTSTTEPTLASAVIFPNPTAEKIHYRSERPVQNAQLYCFDGQLIRTHLSPDQTISLSYFPTGVYWLRLYYQDGSYSYVYIKLFGNEVQSKPSPHPLSRTYTTPPSPQQKSHAPKTESVPKYFPSLPS
ncbi:MAG: T9SS C-terminal target domain-containing protein [Bacteroidetes bacterium]|nr:MAG: T9SS C-terminal target domain-containing protein [Bacteroidota bacterium]